MQYKYSVITIIVVGLSALSNRAYSEESFLRLRSYEPSHITWRSATGDKNALRARYSFKYSLLPNDQNNQPTHDLFLKYTGEFDFYVSTRPSGPVINRISNPGIHYQYSYGSQPDLGFGKLKWLGIGVEHLSNGQTTDVSSASEISKAQAAYVNGDNQYFDGVSRGVNFIMGEAHSVTEFSSSKLSLYGKAKLYLSQDGDITWGPLANKGVRISDYDRIRILARQSFGKLGDHKYKREASIEWTVGDDFLRTDSFNIDYMEHVSVFGADIPVYVRYHYGPMFTLSNYTQSQKSLGFGVKFVPY